MLWIVFRTEQRTEMGAAAGDGVNMFRLVAEGYFLVSWFSPVAILTLFAFTHKNIQYWLFHLILRTLDYKTPGVWHMWHQKICALVFSELLSLGCINLQNFCAHHQVEFLRIPKHPQLAKFGWFWAKLLQFKEKQRLPKIGLID